MTTADETALGEGTPTWTPSTNAARWFEGKSLEDLEQLELGGRHYYPETLKRRVVKQGQEESIPVLVRIPNTAEKAQARVAALTWAGQLLGKQAPPELTIDGVRARLGAVYWEHIDNVCLLSRCVFELAPPHRRYALPEILDAHHPPSSLYDLLERLDWWATQEDPRIGEIDEETVLEVAAAIARKGHTGPLLAIAGLGRESCIVSMARQLVTSRTPKS